MASTIKVDNVQNQPGTNIVSKCSTTITLGQSGDTIALASGATQTGFGRTGTVDWITTPKVTGDSPITAVTGKGYFLNTTAGTITINLPAGAAGSIVSMADYAATWQTNNVTVVADGSEKIGGLTDNATLRTEGQSVTLVYVDSTQGWINTMDSTSNVRGQPPFICASVSGACNTLSTAPDCGDMKIATFLGPGTFTVCTAAICAADNLVSYMVVAGGGGGGTSSGGDNGGGGGAGGYREVVSPTSPYTGSPTEGYPTPANRITVTATAYPITVGAGGAGGCISSASNGVQGSSAIFSTITSAGGGGGGGGTPNGIGPIGRTGVAGGSGGGGGGGSGANNSGGAGNTPPTTPAQGFAGGNSAPTAPPDSAGGGGGGAAEVGNNGSTPGGPGGGGRGGAGVPTQITGSALSYAGGAGTGCGAASPCGTGAAGGNGGAGGTGTTNRGGGGGGARCHGANGAAIGGSGIVVIRYKFQ